jgi:hypothetical protein
MCLAGVAMRRLLPRAAILLFLAGGVILWRLVAEPSIPPYPHVLGSAAFNRQSYFHLGLQDDPYCCATTYYTTRFETSDSSTVITRFYDQEFGQRGWRKLQLQQTPGQLEYLYITRQQNSTTVGYLATIQMVTTPSTSIELSTTSVELRLSSYYNVFEPVYAP